MAGTTEGGKKAAETRGHESLSQAGQKGGQNSSGQKSMETRAEHQGKSVHDVAADMGRKDGSQSQSSPSRDDKNNR